MTEPPGKPRGSRYCYHPHFVDEETEAQGFSLCSRSHGSEWSGVWLYSLNPCPLWKLALQSGLPLPSPLGPILDGLSFLNFAPEAVPPAGPEASFLHAQEDSLRLQHQDQRVEP